MKKRTLTGLLFVLVVAVSTMWAFSTVLHPSKSGFELVFLKDNTLLLSDSDVLSYNWTSQEIFLTDGASQRLIQQGESLYSFTDGFVIRLNGEEIYRGGFPFGYYVSDTCASKNLNHVSKCTFPI